MNVDAFAVFDIEHRLCVSLCRGNLHDLVQPRGCSLTDYSGPLHVMDIYAEKLFVPVWSDTEVHRDMLANFRSAGGISVSFEVERCSYFSLYSSK